MPLFEHQVIIQSSGLEGVPHVLPPVQGLQTMGPTLNTVVTPTSQHLESLEREGREVPLPISGLAIIDTGATFTAVDESICRRLGIKPTGAIRTAHAGGSEIRACYPIRVAFPDIFFPPTTLPQAMSVDLQFGKTPYMVLFGRDLLAKIKFVYNGPAGRFEIAF